jgi:hypothetical protein
LASVLERTKINDASGNAVDLAALRPSPAAPEGPLEDDAE